MRPTYFQGMTTINPRLERVALFSGAHREARRQRDTAICAALDAGLKHTEVADAADLSPAAVRKIRDLAHKAREVDQ